MDEVTFDRGVGDRRFTTAPYPDQMGFDGDQHGTVREIPREPVQFTQIPIGCHPLEFRQQRHWRLCGIIVGVGGKDTDPAVLVRIETGEGATDLIPR